MGWSRQERIELHDKMVVKLDEVRRELMRRFPEVVSVDLGIKQTHGQPLEELSWRVFVRSKKAADELKPEEMIPKEILGLRTDVQTQPAYVNLVEDASKYRPLWAGSKISVPTVRVTDMATGIITITNSSGTLGCFVRLNANNRVHLLTNEHVIGSTPGKLIGQSAPPEPDYCCCCDGGGVATWTASAIGMGVSLANNVDAAIAVLFGQTPGDSRAVAYSNNILEIGPVFGSSTDVIFGDVIRKRGKTTQLTAGTVQSITHTVTTPDGVKYTGNQIQVTVVAPYAAMADHGDSGSVFVNNRNQVVGLLATGAPGGPSAAGGLIQNVEAALGVTVISSAHAGHPDTIPLSGANLAPPPVLTATPTHFLTKIEGRLKETVEGQAFLQVVHENRTEVLDLINDNREVKVAWNRYQGPTFVGHFAKNVMEPSHRFPDQIEGYSFQNLLIKMTDVLERHGSRKLAKAIEDYSPIAFNFADQYQGFDSLDTLLRKANICPNCGQPQTLNDYAE